MRSHAQRAVPTAFGSALARDVPAGRRLHVDEGGSRRPRWTDAHARFGMHVFERMGA